MLPDNQGNIKQQFVKYVTQNVLGMLGVSCYILADTFFISLVEGADGITALNLVLPIYSLLFGIGQMIAVGSATRFALLRAQGDTEGERYFSNAIFGAFLISLAFMAAGGLFPDRLLTLLGADEKIVAVGTGYTRIFMMFAPVFMWNYICNAFVRNDRAPSIAMAATLCSSLFNIVMDYILMFPMGLGMAGAALATAISPVVGILICFIHFFSRKNTIHFYRGFPSVYRLYRGCQLGVAAFVGEMSSGVTTMVFNILILGLAGNNGVAAYGVIANAALVATAVFNGIAQGIQPLLSDAFGRRDQISIRRILHLAVGLAIGISVCLIGGIYGGTDGIVSIFNSEGNVQMADYAALGIRWYFIGFLFAGFNIVATGYLSATGSAGWAFAASAMRGFIAIILCALVLSRLFGMIGIWMAFPGAELLTLLVTGCGLWKTQKTE